MAQNLPRGTPGRVMVILALLAGGVVVSAWRDALQRHTTEWVRHPTALGDTGMLQAAHLPATLNTGGKAVSLAAGQSIFHRRDDKMFRVVTGLQAPLPFTLFTTSENLTANGDPKLYARTAPHQYVRLRANLAGEAPQPPVIPALPPAAKPPATIDEAQPFDSREPSVFASDVAKTRMETADSAPIEPSLPTAPPPNPPSSSQPAPIPVAKEEAPAPAPSRPIASSKPPGPKKPTIPAPQVPPGEDPDKALALPAPKAAAAAYPAVPPPPVVLPPGDKPPVIRRAEPIPDDEPTPAPIPPKAIPLPPEEQDSPVAEAQKGTL